MDSSDYNSDSSFSSTDSSLSSDGSDSLYGEDGDHGHHLLHQLRELNKKFRLACKQVVLMNNEIEYLQTRYNRAVTGGNRSFRYFHRLKISTLEGVRNKFYDYASQHADKLDALHAQLLTEGIIEEELDLEELNESSNC